MAPADAETFGDWSFDLWATVESNAPNASAALDRITLEMFNGLGLMQHFGLDAGCLKRFLHRVDVAMSLRRNPYHNRFHSFDVAQSVFVIATRMSCSDYLGPLELLALLVSALCHDLEHPGHNNAFAVNASTPLAVRYNDSSPLENHHIAVAWTILRSAGCGLLAPLEESQCKRFRKLMITSILATDMTCHFALKEELDGVILRNQPPSPSSSEAMAALRISQSESGGGGGGLNDDDDDDGGGGGGGGGGEQLDSDLDRTVLLKTVLHVADISNPCKPWAVSKIWSDRVLEEFFAQGDAEEALSLTPTPNMARATTKQAELSVNFVDFIVGPFFMALTSLLPKVFECCEFMRDNRAEWHRRIVKDYEASAAAGTIAAAKKDEAVAKWTRREVAFNDVVTPLIQQAKGKAGCGEEVRFFVGL